MENKFFYMYKLLFIDTKYKVKYKNLCHSMHNFYNKDKYNLI